MKTAILPAIKIFLTGVVVFLISQRYATAQIVDSIHYGWTVYEYDKSEEDGGKECYIASFAKNSDTSHTIKRNPYLLITRYSATRKEEVSVYAGYEYKINSHAFLLIDDKQYQMFTGKDAAWFRKDADDKEVIQKMLGTNIVRFRSDSAIGTYAIDEYWMKGLTRAYARMKELCK